MYPKFTMNKSSSKPRLKREVFRCRLPECGRISMSFYPKRPSVGAPAKALETAHALSTPGRIMSTFLTKTSSNSTISRLRNGQWRGTTPNMQSGYDVRENSNTLESPGRRPPRSTSTCANSRPTSATGR